MRPRQRSECQRQYRHRCALAPLEPVAVWARFQGLWVSPKASFSQAHGQLPQAISGTLVRPIEIKPAAFIFVTMWASTGAFVPSALSTRLPM